MWVICSRAVRVLVFLHRCSRLIPFSPMSRDPHHRYRVQHEEAHFVSSSRYVTSLPFPHPPPFPCISSCSLPLIRIFHRFSQPAKEEGGRSDPYPRCKWPAEISQQDKGIVKEFCPERSDDWGGHLSFVRRTPLLRHFSQNAPLSHSHTSMSFSVDLPVVILQYGTRLPSQNISQRV